MLNGTLLSEADLATVDPANVATCASCNGSYFTTVHKAITCWPCWYEQMMDGADERFSGLAAALARRLEVWPTVDNTGGMVMCLRVPIGQRYFAWFSDLDEYIHDQSVYFGVYDDESQDCDEVAMYERDFAIDADHGTTWSEMPELCEQVAEWAAPLIVAHLEQGDTP